MANEFADDVTLHDLPLWGDEEARQILEAICQKHQVPLDVITQLVTIQRERQHEGRAHGINQAFEEALSSID